MSLAINKSFVPRVAVQRTIALGIEAFEKIHGPANQAVRDKITKEVIRLANIQNASASALQKEQAMSDTREFYQGRKP
jgi:hypothetical protein